MSTPEMAKRKLYERSGHWAHYQDDMYPPMDVGTEQVVMRPMNCPHHILVYRSEPRTMREIPFRLAELGTMFRYERSGVVGGLSRARQMTLNEAMCSAPLSTSNNRSRRSSSLSTSRTRPWPYRRQRCACPGKATARNTLLTLRPGRGSEELVRSALAGLGLEYIEAEGEAALYGPKIDLQVVDPQGREETLSTIQLDFLLPERFELSFRRGPDRTGLSWSTGRSCRPWSVWLLTSSRSTTGRSPSGSPPTQVVAMPVSPVAVAYSWQVKKAIGSAGLRAQSR